MTLNIKKFIAESNRIEGIDREPTQDEIDITTRFINAYAKISIADLEQLVAVYAPGNQLRLKRGMDVTVGDYKPPYGGPHIKELLEEVLAIRDPWEQHCEYETLHPFTDGNGRSGRALWLFRMMNRNYTVYNSSFLHTFYYQTLDSHDSR